MKTIYSILYGLLFTALVTACSRVLPPPQTNPENIRVNGFLGQDAKRLRPGDTDKDQYAALVYLNPKAQWSQYKNTMIDPVTVWRGQTENYDGMSRADVQHLANIFYQTIHEELSKDYNIVKTPGKDTMRIQIALSKAEESNPVLDFTSTLIPFARVGAEASQLIVGKAPFVGSATIEAKITDSESGETLSAVVDQRYGQKRIEKGFDRKADVKYLFSYWAKALRYRLCMKSGRTGCVAP